MKTITSSGQKIPALLTIAIEMAGYPCYTPKGVWGNAHAHAFKLASLLLFLFGFNSAKCQHAITEAQYLSNINTTIIKEYQYPATISYIETYGNNYFAYADASMSIVNCEIEPYIHVKDFVIFEDKVYFCGVDNSIGPNGIWGWFNISDLTAGNLVYETYSNFSCNNAYVDLLESIEVYRNNGIMHIVCAGSSVNGAASSGCAIEITPSISGLYQWDYTIGLTKNDHQHIISHVCLTDNYVITSGLALITSGFEVYRRHSKNNIFATGGPQDEFWVFPCSNFDYYARNTSQYAITYMYDDVIASAFQTNNLTGTNQYGALVFVHDMATLTNGAISTIFACSQTTLNDQYIIEGLKYDKLNKSLVLLLYDPQHYSRVAEIPIMAPPLVFSLHTISDVHLTSMDLYNNSHNFVCQGFGVLPYSNNVCTSFTQPLNSTSICASTMIPNGFSHVYITKWDPSPFTTCKASFDCIRRYQRTKYYNTNELECIETRSTR